MINCEILPNGDLKIVFAGDRDDIDWSDYTGAGNYTFMLECLEIESIPSEVLGALTDAPIFGESVSREDDGSTTVVGRIWWWPNYMIRDFVEVLKAEGEVILPMASNFREPGINGGTPEQQTERCRLAYENCLNPTWSPTFEAQPEHETA